MEKSSKHIPVKKQPVAKSNLVITKKEKNTPENKEGFKGIKGGKK